MEKENEEINDISDEDLRAALRDVKTYVDITEEDLRKIYAIALRHARERAVAKVPVGEVMTERVVAVHRDDDIHEAARLLSENGISGLPVVDAEKHVIGIISEADILSLAGMKRGHTFRDILRHVLGEPLPERKPGNKVGDVMSSPAITIKKGADVREAARILDEHRIKRLPVVDDASRLIGIISRADIVKVISRK